MLWRSVVPLLRLSLAGYTDQAVRAVSAAWRLADSLGHPAVTLGHLRTGLAEPGARWPGGGPSLRRCRGIGPAARSVLAAARRDARRAGCRYVATEHLAAALAASGTGDAEPGAAADGGGQ